MRHLSNIDTGVLTFVLHIDIGAKLIVYLVDLSGNVIGTPCDKETAA